jgi:enterochelin esterase-like enzyme
MLEPQSTLLFILLIAVFGGLMWWIVTTRRLAFRIGAAVLAFLVAMQVGIMAVNKYFDYYQTWGAAITDLTGPAATGPSLPKSVLGSATGKKESTGDQGSSDIYLSLAEKQGYLEPLQFKGATSHISRQGLIYLPPQYFQPAYRNYRFPVIELIHGQPGFPEDWIDVVGVTQTLDTLVSKHLAEPAVLVMPDANGGQRVSEQCLNQVGGPQDMTYLGVDVPADVLAAGLRVQAPGRAWGIAGYSEGGFCAANMALHFRSTYGFAGVMSGYFKPMHNQLPSGKIIDPFDGNANLRAANTPTLELRSLRPGAVIPKFWVGAGQEDGTEVTNAYYFVQLLSLHQANVPVDISPGGHTMGAWRAEVSPMLEWMTIRLAQFAVPAGQGTPVAQKSPSPCGTSSVVVKRKPGPGPTPSCSPRPPRKH